MRSDILHNIFGKIGIAVAAKNIVDDKEQSGLADSVCAFGIATDHI